MLRPTEAEMRSSWMEGFVEFEDNADPRIDDLKVKLENVRVLRACDGLKRRRREEPRTTETTEAPPNTHPPASSHPPETPQPGPSTDRNYFEEDWSAGTHFGGFQESVIRRGECASRTTGGGGADSEVGAILQKVTGLERELELLKGKFLELSNELGEVKSSNTKLEQEMRKMKKKNVSNLVRLNDAKQPRERRAPYWMHSPSWTAQGKKRKASNPNPEDVARRFTGLGKRMNVEC